MDRSEKNDFGLTDMEDRFCREYLVDLELAKAYHRAGFQENTKNIIGKACKLLQKPEIQARLVRLKKELDEGTEISKIMVLKELGNIAFSNILDICSWDADGKFSVKDWQDIPDDVKAGIKKFFLDVRIRVPKKSKYSIHIDFRVLLEMHPKMKALEMLSNAIPLRRG